MSFRWDNLFGLTGRFWPGFAIASSLVCAALACECYQLYSDRKAARFEAAGYQKKSEALLDDFVAEKEKHDATRKELGKKVDDCRAELEKSRLDGNRLVADLVAEKVDHEATRKKLVASVAAAPREATSSPVSQPAPLAIAAPPVVAPAVKVARDIEIRPLVIPERRLSPLGMIQKTEDTLCTASGATGLKALPAMPLGEDAPVCLKQSTPAEVTFAALPSTGRPGPVASVNLRDGNVIWTWHSQKPDKGTGPLTFMDKMLKAMVIELSSGEQAIVRCQLPPQDVDVHFNAAAQVLDGPDGMHLDGAVATPAGWSVNASPNVIRFTHSAGVATLSLDAATKKIAGTWEPQKLPTVADVAPKSGVLTSADPSMLRAKEAEANSLESEIQHYQRLIDSYSARTAGPKSSTTLTRHQSNLSQAQARLEACRADIAAMTGKSKSSMSSTATDLLIKTRESDANSLEGDIGRLQRQIASYSNSRSSFAPTYLTRYQGELKQTQACLAARKAELVTLGAMKKKETETANLDAEILRLQQQIISAGPGTTGDALSRDLKMKQARLEDIKAELASLSARQKKEAEISALEVEGLRLQKQIGVYVSEPTSPSLTRYQNDFKQNQTRIDERKAELAATAKAPKAPLTDSKETDISTGKATELEIGELEARILQLQKLIGNFAPGSSSTVLLGYRSDLKQKQARLEACKAEVASARQRKSSPSQADKANAAVEFQAQVTLPSGLVLYKVKLKP